MSSPMKLSDLVTDPKNRRKHTTQNLDMLRDSIEQLGTGRSIVIDEHNEVIAGNATIKAAAQAGLSKVRVVEVDGSEVVAVRRTGLSAKQKRDLAIYDNRTAELAEWDMEQLAEDAADQEDLSGFFSPQEVQSILASSDPVDLGAVFTEAPAGEGEPLVPLVLSFTAADHLRVSQALQSQEGSPEHVVLRLLGLTPAVDG